MKTFEFEGVEFVPTGVIYVDKIICQEVLGIKTTNGYKSFFFSCIEETESKRKLFIGLLNEALK